MACKCRSEGDDQEAEPPAAGHKRFEARLSADGGSATLELPGVGTFTADGMRESCFYFDLPGGAVPHAVFASRAAHPRQGFTPRLRLAEYGPAGPHWYQILEVECVGAGGRCDKGGAEAWATRTRGNRRGRQDPCGSAVLSKLHWDTSGAESSRDGGYFHDLVVSFDFEVKRFATQFRPGSTECQPK